MDIPAPHSSIYAMSTSVDEKLLVPKPEIPPSPPALSKDDYDDVKFWFKADWIKFQLQEKEAGRTPARLRFLTDEQGKDITQD